MMREIRFTPQQQAVAENRGGTLLVSAAAGSGKTKVLVERVLRRIVEDGKNIQDFLIITFTNAAAAELRMKISDAISEALAERPGNRHLSRQLNLMHLSQISTVHAFCGALIRQFGYLLDIPADCRMLEDSEQKALLEKVLEEILEEAYERGENEFLLLTDTLGAGRTDQALSDLIKSVYEKLMSQPDPQRWLGKQSERLTIGAETDLAKTQWGEILADYARKQLCWLVDRYTWAVNAMQGDELLSTQYLPCYEMQLASLKRMIPALDGDWDDIAGQLEMEYPRISVRKYPDPDFLDAIKTVKSDGKETLSSLRRMFSRSSAELRREQNDMAPALGALLELVGALYRRFSAEKRRKNLLDFADQEHLAIRLLIHAESGRPTEVAKEVSERFAEIMVDEYQDSNRVQEIIFTAISGARDENRFLVGDVKQSIYGFRQAEPGLFLEKYRTFVPAEKAADPEPRKLILSKNFRSRPEILEAVNHTFETVMSESVGDLTYGPDEHLYPGLEHYPDIGKTPVELYVLELQQLPADQEETKYQREAQWVAGRIRALLEEGALIRDGDGTRPVRPEDIAILLRTRDPLALYSRALRDAGIPVAADHGENLFDTPEVKVLVDLLRVLNNPHQDVPLLAVLCSPVFRLSNEQLASIRSASKKSRFYDAMRECREPWCVRVVNRLENLRRSAGTESADGLIWQLLHETGLLSAYSAMEGGARRRENLLRIYQLSLNAASGGYLYLYHLIRLLDRAAEGGDYTTSDSAGGVVLTTMHKSKGLEYPVVVLPDLTRRFNLRELNNSLLFDGDLGLGAKVTDRDLRVRYPGVCFEALKLKKKAALRSEEMRILYVAMTRAKDRLIMTFAGNHIDSTLSGLRAGAGQPAAPWASADAGCLGDWVLLSALNRVEAGAFFDRCGRPDCELKVSEYPWRIMLEQVEKPAIRRWQPLDEQSPERTDSLPSPQQITEYLRWQDPHRSATVTPSKLTATQLKGREKDTEAAEGAKVQPRLPQLRRPDFVLEKKGLSATEQGTAVHLFLQYARFNQCTSAEGIEEEKLRLEDEEFLTPEQLEAVQPEKILTLFRSELGKRMLTARDLVREFKFSMLWEASDYYPDVPEEKVLLQGVVDAAIVEEDGICVIDFKTDRVNESTVHERTAYYRGQLTAYQKALARMFDRPVKEMYLYFLSLGREVKL